MRGIVWMLAGWLFFAGSVLGSDSPRPREQKLAGSRAVVGRYKAAFDKPAKGASSKVTDAVLMGNGDIGIAMSGPPEAIRFWINKNDFWRLKNGYGQTTPKPIGGVDLQTAALKGAKYRVEQDLYTATTFGEFSGVGCTLQFKGWVAASANLFVLELQSQGKAVAVEVKNWVMEGSGSENDSGSAQTLHWMTRKFVKDVDIATAAAVAVKVLGAGKEGDLRFSVEPGRKVVLVVGVESLFKNRDYPGAVKRMVGAVDERRIAELRKEHEAWWADYWAKSYVDIGTGVVEKQYYMSLYLMGSCSRDPEFAPPIFGTWTLTDKPAWAGDYHMNYNHVAPFYGLYSSNRIEQADPQDAPLLDFMAHGRKYSRMLYGTRGVVYPVGIGPKGIDSTFDGARYRTTKHQEKGVLLFGQKSNSAYATVNMIQRWYFTRDEKYGRKVYPFVREVASFWEDYLKYEEGADGRMRYVIYNDAVHEGTHGDFNPVLSLGLVRMVFAAALDMTAALDVDRVRREKWRHILEHLSEFPVRELEDGTQVFRYTERGREYFGSNTLGIQHIYPAGAIGLDSEAELVETSRNMIGFMGRWIDMNGSNSFLPAAVRVGYDGDVILDKLADYASRFEANGLSMRGNPHGIENCSTVPNTVNMMLCMSWGGVIRPFRVWPRHRDASFSDIRCWGAFLVSGRLAAGEVQFVRILSEKGRRCVVENPWERSQVVVNRRGGKTDTLSGQRLEFDTGPGEVVVLKRQVAGQM